MQLLSRILEIDRFSEWNAFPKPRRDAFWTLKITLIWDSDKNDTNSRLASYLDIFISIW